MKLSVPDLSCRELVELVTDYLEARLSVEERTRLLQQEITEHEHTEGQLAAETRRVQAEIEERKRMVNSLPDRTVTSRHAEPAAARQLNSDSDITDFPAGCSGPDQRSDCRVDAA